MIRFNNESEFEKWVNNIRNHNYKYHCKKRPNKSAEIGIALI